ncbi:MAG: hypothetical protein ACFFG0_44015 [Candidatus Thorarchaeota archaeon]
MTLDVSIIVSLITVSGSIFTAGLVYYFTKKHQLEMDWRKEKINHYKVLLSSLSDLAVDGTDKEKANKKFSLAFNTIALVAPQYVITALMNFHDEVKCTNLNKSLEKHDELLKELLLAIRKDIKWCGKDDINSFKFHLMGSAPKNK